MAGISDWMAAGLPIEGRKAAEPTIGSLAHTDVPSCGPDDLVGDVRERVRAAGLRHCFVVNEHGVVLGRLHWSDLKQADDGAPVEEVMRPGPSTYRANVPADQLLDVMEQKEIHTAPVTRPDGTLIGLVRREDLERVASKPSAGAGQRAE
ncbi:MAG: CBS domain-containing protein [Candidatus Limnocylindria bacterium]